MITTHLFHLAKKEYFSIIVRTLIKKDYWKILLLWISALLAAIFVKEKNELMIFGIVIAFLLPFFMVFEYWRHAFVKENAIFYSNKYFEITESELAVYNENGSSGKIQRASFYKQLVLKDAYLLYLAKNQSVIVPKRIFKTKNDLQLFETWFIGSNMRLSQDS